ncbi:MAG: hypothetical protein HOP29_06075 [Phycisphaerales bacterium]|nr:hypothetical protein [Phycisphaerales bacterium]
MLACGVPLPTEPALSALPACMDSTAVLEAARDRLHRVDPAERECWREARLIEALYHPGRYARMVYALLRNPATPTDRAWPEEQLLALFTPLRATMSRRGDVLRIAGHDVEAYCFPNDRRLRGLRTFARRDRVLETWRSWSGGSGEQVDEDTLQRKLVRYVPEQKCVVRVRAEWSSTTGGAVVTRRVAVRSSPTAGCQRLERRHRQVCGRVGGGASGFVVPGVVGFNPRRGLLALEWLRGDTLVEALRRGDEFEVMTRVVRALREFHGMTIPDLAELTGVGLVNSVADALTDLTATCPDLHEPLSILAEGLPRGLAGMESGPPVTLHNDLHGNQVTVKKNRVAILDLERLAVGAADIDVANLATQLHMLGVRPDHDVDAVTADRWRGALLACWKDASRCEWNPARFHLLAARSRLELARGILRHLRPWWQPFVAECVTRAVDDLIRAASREEVA